MEIDARALAPKLDRRADQWTPETLHRTFLKYGCAVVRGGIDHATQAKIKEAIDAAYLSRPGPQVWHPDIMAASGGRVSGWELVDTTLLQDFLAIAFAGQDWRPSHVATRRVKVASNQEWMKPLELHLDTFFHDFNFTINFWAPFDACGVDAPSLQLVPLNYRRTRAYSRFTGKVLRENEEYKCGYFRPDINDPNAATKHFGRNCFFRPEMMPGDVIISSNWIIHGTYCTPHMTKGRTDAELRFIGSSLEINASRLLVRLARLFSTESYDAEACASPLFPSGSHTRIGCSFCRWRGCRDGNNCPGLTGEGKQLVERSL
jgi:hypothetical protein